MGALRKFCKAPKGFQSVKQGYQGALEIFVEF